MSSPEATEKSNARRLVEASAWCTHLAENDLESTPAFEVWLADPRNREAWDRVRQGWELFGQQATSPELLDLRRRALGQARSMVRERWGPTALARRLRYVSIAAVFLLVAFGGAVTLYVMRSDVYQTQVGERRVIALADGSRVHLDSLTELRADYSSHARDLTLVRGQARFDVERDVQRPFSVVAAGRKVVATGTAFNVDLLGKDLFVTLIEGKVVVVPAATSAASAIQTSPISEGKNKPIRLSVGEQLAVSDDRTTTVTAGSVQRALAWQNGQIVVENEPLSAVAMRVNRYSARPVRLTDEHTGSLRISGVFNTGDVDGFVVTITHYLPLRAEQRDDAIYLGRSERPESERSLWPQAPPSESPP